MIMKYKIIQSKNLTMNYFSHKESHHFRNLYFPNALPRENRRSTISNLMIKRLSVKLPTSIEASTKTLTKTITTTSPRNPRLDQVKKEAANSHSHWISYKILSSTLYHFHPLEDSKHQKYKLPYCLNTQITEDKKL